MSVGSGTFRVPLPGEGASGLAPWEYTIAELLSDAGYATALYPFIVSRRALDLRVDLCSDKTR